MDRKLQFEKLKNTRDLGGMRTADARQIRSGKLIRSGQLFFASAADRADLFTRIETVVDFRTDKERMEKPDPLGEGISFVHIPILNSLRVGVTRDTASEEETFRILMESPRRAVQYMTDIYAGFVNEEACRTGYRRFLDILLEEHDKAVLWHCTAGKDRAGFASVIMEEILGVPWKTIREDYLATNLYLKKDVEELMEMMHRWMGPGTPESDRALYYLFSAQEEFLNAAYCAAEDRYGSFSAFLKDGLLLTEEEQKKLRAQYLD